ncbi:MAG: hypothetical protein PVI81_05180 [Anaerolineales bacterium]
MNLSNITGIGRPFDPKFPTNIAIAVLSILVAAFFGVFSLIAGLDLISALIAAFRASLTLFLGWAIAREFDPDHPYSAFPAAFAILATLVAGYSTNLLFLAFLLLMLRYINHSTGLSATIVDLSFGFILTVWLSWSMDWIVGILGAVAYTLDALRTEKRTNRFVFAGLSMIAALVAVLLGPSNPGFVGLQITVALISAVLILIALPLYLSYEECTSVGDYTDQQLDPQGIQLAQIFYLGSVILLGIKMGFQDSGVMLPAGSISVAVGLYYLLSLLLPKLNSK